MARGRPGPDPDRLLIARISGIARRHAQWSEPAEPEIAAAVAELREIAGILLGFHKGALDEPGAKAAAQLLIAAGADQALILQWTEVGKHRAEAARQPPSSGGIRS
ncbi:MAG: hypothetical protein ACRDPD_19815 [Streptosporangiaceae bacterium]